MDRSVAKRIERKTRSEPMRKESSPSNRIFLVVVLVSLTLGFVAAGIIVVYGITLWPFVPISHYVTAFLTPGAGLRSAADTAFLVTAMVYSAIIAVPFLLLSRLATSQRVLVRWAGVVMLIAPPLSWFVMSALHSPFVYLLLTLEIGVSSFAVFYLSTGSTAFRWQLGLIALVHWGSWIWLFWHGIPSHAATLIPGVAAFSFVMWFLLNHRKPSLAPPTTPTTTSATASR